MVVGSVSSVSVSSTKLVVLVLAVLAPLYIPNVHIFARKAILGQMGQMDRRATSALGDNGRECMHGLHGPRMFQGISNHSPAR